MPITEFVQKVFHWLKWLGPMRWASVWYRELKPRSELTPAELTREFTARRAYLVENYMRFFLLVEFTAALSVCLFQLPFVLRLFVCVLVAFRIIEIFQVSVNVSLFDSVSGRPDQRVATLVRIITLAGVNYLELLVCFGVIYGCDIKELRGAGQGITCFYFSAITQLTIGYGDIHPTGWLRAVASLQGLTAFAFVILVFARFLSSFAPMGEILEHGRIRP